MLYGTFFRNVFSHVPGTWARKFAAMLKAIYAQESLVAGDVKAADAVTKLRSIKLEATAQLLENTIHETVAIYIPTHPSAESN